MEDSNSICVFSLFELSYLYLKITEILNIFERSELIRNHKKIFFIIVTSLCVCYLLSQINRIKKISTMGK